MFSKRYTFSSILLTSLIMLVFSCRLAAAHPVSLSEATVDVYPDHVDATLRIMVEDFGHPAHLPRAGDPKEIGPVIAFAASRVNSYMTGANVNVDGGSDFT